MRKTAGFLKTPTPGGVPVITTSPGDKVTNLQDQQNMLVLHHGLQLQLNSVNTVTNGPKTFGRINEGFFTRKSITVFYQVTKKSGRNNEVARRRGFTVFSKGGTEHSHGDRGRRAKGGDINNLIPKSPQDAKINLISRIYSTTFLLKQYYSLVISF